MFTLGGMTDKLELSSIDEAFMDISSHKRFGYEKFCREIVSTVENDTGIGVSIGGGANKTLAKIANRFSKKIERFKNVFLIDSEEKRIECLKRTRIEDVWGIGKELSEKLNMLGVFFAIDFITKINQREARKIFNVNLERTWCELNGIKCYELEYTQADKKTISTTRSFPHDILTLQELKSNVATYAAICGSDLRRQNSFASTIQVYLMTNRHRNVPQYNPYREIVLPVPSNTTYTLSKYAIQAIEDMYIEGFRYKKAGVIIKKNTYHVQPDIFKQDPLENKFAKISPIEDFYSHGFNRKKLYTGIMGNQKLIGEDECRCYTTDFSQIMRIDCTF